MQLYIGTLLATISGRHCIVVAGRPAGITLPSRGGKYGACRVHAGVHNTDAACICRCTVGVALCTAGSCEACGAKVSERVQRRGAYARPKPAAQIRGEGVERVCARSCSCSYPYDSEQSPVCY